MAKYKAVHPETGKTLIVEGDTPPTEKEWDEIFAVTFGQQKPMTAGEKVVGGLETAATMATGAIAEPIAGLAGIAGTLLPGDPGQGARAVQAVQQGMTYMPRTESGQRALQATGEALQPIGEALGAISDYTGNLGYQIGGATGGAIGKALPTLAGEVIGLKAPALAASVATRAAGRQAVKGAELAQQSADIMAEQPTKAGMTAYAQAMKSGQPQDIAEMVNPDPRFFEATEQLGIKAEPLAAYAS